MHVHSRRRVRRPWTVVIIANGHPGVYRRFLTESAANRCRDDLRKTSIRPDDVKVERD